MTRQQIYNTNIQLQSMTEKIVHACHIQNYDYVVRNFTTVTENLMLVLEAVFADISFYNQETELVNPEEISLALQDILAAQDSQDYVLMADLLELRLLSFLQSLQEAIRTYDGLGTSPEVWERNMEALKKRDDKLWKQVMEYHERYERENAAGTWQGIHHLEDTNSGAFTMAGQDEKGIYYYHSNVSPMKEAADFAGYYYDRSCDSYILWGLGLGYHVKELFSLDDGISLQVFESDMDVIYHCLMATEMDMLFALPGFSLIYDPDFSKMIATLDETTKSFIIHNPSLRHIPDAGIREQMEMFFIRDSGKRNAAVLFEANSRENFRNFDGYVDELKSQFQGKDVIIVAAGPSLDKNVEQLKNKKPGTIIMAVETVFRKLLSLGIDVDYMIVTDANSRIYGHMTGLENQTVPMLYLATAYKGFAKNYQGKKYLICQKGYDKAEELAHKQGWNLYDTGGSVSTTALDVCIRLGCGRIAFIGLDLAYTGNLAHATGTARREAEETELMKQVPAVGGGSVPVSRLFMMYNRWIVERVKQSDVTMPVVDATEGGAVIPGLEVMTLGEYLGIGEAPVKKRIDILIPIGDKGGVENIINMTVPYMQQKGMEVRVIQLISTGVEWTTEGIPYYTLLEGLAGHTLAEFSECYKSFLEKMGAPDCILATAWPSMCYVARKTMMLLENSAIRIISWLHAPVKCYENSGYGSYDSLELADAHFAISQSIYDDILEHLPESRVEYVYNPVDFEKCRQAEVCQCRNTIHRLYFVGRVSEEKRLDVIIQGVAAAGDTWELFVIGDDDNRYGESMKQLTQDLDAAGRVHWLGWKENPWSFVKDADALVLASEFEGFPLAAIEAQANGIPVISTPVSGIEEMITPGVNGYIFPFGDWKKLSDILYGISTNAILPFDSDVCREKAARFEKNTALSDFYNKLCAVLFDE